MLAKPYIWIIGPGIVIYQEGHKVYREQFGVEGRINTHNILLTGSTCVMFILDLLEMRLFIKTYLHFCSSVWYRSFPAQTSSFCLLFLVSFLSFHLLYVWLKENEKDPLQLIKNFPLLLVGLQDNPWFTCCTAEASKTVMSWEKWCNIRLLK